MQSKRENFHSLYIQYHVLVYNLALHYLQNPEDAEEITQDVFLKLYDSIEKFENRSSVKTWIYRITVNACLDFIKYKKSKKNFFIFGNRSDKAHDITNFEHPGILLENQENAQILFDVINELGENQKTAFILSKLDGLGNAEISDIMKLSISSVESLIFRAKAALKEKLASKFEVYRKKK